MEEVKEKSKVLIVGGTGRIGKWLVKASLDQGHPTYVLQQRETSSADHAAAKLQAYMELQLKGVVLIIASFSDHKSLVDAVKGMDVVISAMGYYNHSLLLQLKLVDAIKEAGNVKRFIPAEFGVDPRWLSDLILPGREAFYEKMAVRKAIEDEGIPHTYILANLYAMFFVAGLCQLNMRTPPRDHVVIYGDGNIKAIFVDENDIATYTMKTIDDPRTLNKTLHIRPMENIISQREMVGKWEHLLGYTLGKTFIPANEFLSSLKEDKDLIKQGRMGHFYHFFYEGYVNKFEKGEFDEGATELYPEVKYTRIEDYLQRFQLSK